MSAYDFALMSVGCAIWGGLCWSARREGNTNLLVNVACILYAACVVAAVLAVRQWAGEMAYMK